MMQVFLLRTEYYLLVLYQATTSTVLGRTCAGASGGVPSPGRLEARRVMTSTPNKRSNRRRKEKLPVGASTNHRTGVSMQQTAQNGEPFLTMVASSKMGRREKKSMF